MSRRDGPHRRVAWQTKLAALAATILALFTLPAIGAAHDSPHVLRVVWTGNEHSVVLVTNRGLIFGDPSTQHWQLMCNEALHLNTMATPDAAYLPDGRVVVNTYRGLRSTTDQGCTWQGVEPYGMSWTNALVQDPAKPELLYIATYGAGNGAVRMTKDAGATWSDLYTVEDNDFIQELRIAPSKHELLYVSGQVLDMQGHYTQYLVRSDDGGKTWKRHDLDVLHDGESDFVLLAVSPKDPDVLIARAQAGNPMMMQDRILVSRDGGTTFDSPANLTTIFDAGFSADGSRIWVTGTEGLLQSSDGGKSFVAVEGTLAMTCVFARDDQVFACGHFSMDGNGVGVSTDEGTTFKSWAAFTDVTEPVTCDAMTETATTCAPLWVDWEREIFGIWDAGVSASGGTGGTTSMLPDAGTMGTPVMPADSAVAERVDAGTPPGKHHGSGGCAVLPGADVTRAGASALLLAALAWVARRRAR